MAPGLCIFGDCAYTNTKYFATPFVSATGAKDDYNFYHSQLRINIECAFGMLVHRWAILRSALSNNYSLIKVKELVRCLCSLHNFLIDCNFTEVQSTYYGDVVSLHTCGAFAVEESQLNDNGIIPEPLIRGGEHFDDHQRPRQSRDDEQPREKILRLIEEGHYTRPIPN